MKSSVIAALGPFQYDFSMKLSSPLRGHREGRSRERHDSSSSASGTNRTALRKSLASFVSSSSSDFSSHPCAVASGPGACRGRAPESPCERRSKRKKAESEKNDKKKRSKKSRKKKHHKKKRRASTSCSSSSVSSRSPSRSVSRSRSRLFSSRTDQLTPPSATTAPSSSSSACQAGDLHSKRSTGWDVGPDFLERRNLPAGARHLVSRYADSGNFSSSKEPTPLPLRERNAAHEEREKCQQHDPKTYEKAFGVAIPSGKYDFVSEETDLALLLPTAGTGHVRTSPAAAGALSPSPTRIAAAGGSESASVGRPFAAPPALGILRLLKEANEAEKGRQEGTDENGAQGLRKGSGRGGSKVTSKTHPHLFWQCWNCSADNYKTRHQCYRCNRLYMQ